MNLYELTLAAEASASTYRHPNIAEWLSAIDPVLEAAGESCIGQDTVTSIYVDGDDMTVCTSYIVKGCADTDSVSLPVSILRADNPIQAATRYKLDRAIRSAKRALEDSQRQVSIRATTLAQLEAELADLCVADSSAAS